MDGDDLLSCIDFFCTKMEGTMLCALSKYTVKMNPKEAARRMGSHIVLYSFAAILI